MDFEAQARALYSRRPPNVKVSLGAQADAAEDGCRDFAAAAAPPPESSVTGFGAGGASTNGSGSDR
jgi:hypothetical protein